MSISKVLCTALATVAVGTLFAADANSTLITFSSSGDTYADGSPVLEGEWYALCWSANETFGGVDAACKPLVEGDVVVRAHPIAKNGGCPYVVFVLSGDEAKTTGYYFVCLLDTRATATGPVAAATSDSLPARVNSRTVAMTTSALSGVEAGISSGATDQTASASVADALATVTEPAKIVKLDPSGDEVLITVANMHPLVAYNIKYGEKVSDITTSTLRATAQKGNYAGGNVIFSVTKENANFFQLIQAE